MQEIMKNCFLKYAKNVVLSVFKKGKKRLNTIMIFVCLCIILIGVYYTYKTSYAVRSIQPDLWQPHKFADIRISKRRLKFNVENQVSFRKFYFKPETRDKQIYVWQKGQQIPGNISLAKFKGHLINQASCAFLSQNVTKEPNCVKIHKELKDINYFSFSEEKDIKIAYSILVYTDYEMIELLLRTIYKPQNTYCIHIDDKSPIEFKHRVRGLADCFDNVFIASKLVEVYWGKFSVVEAEMSCMKDLLNKSKLWKYFINLTGHEFPLRTNYEIAKILKTLRGYNNMRCIKQRIPTNIFPYGLRIYKTGTHVVLTRAFVEYLLYNETVQTVLNLTKTLKIPDEKVFSTINCNEELNAPGAFKGRTSALKYKANYIARFKMWMEYSHRTCHGIILRGLCSFGLKDLDILRNRHELFAHKFNIKHFPQVQNCLRNVLLQRTYLEYAGRLDYNVTYYERIPYISKNEIKL